MTDLIKENLVLFTLLTGGLADAILTAVVAYIRRDKVRLGRYVKRRTIIEEQPSDVSISFRNRPIYRLDQQEIILKNIGNRVIENVSIIVTVTGDILDKNLEKPDGANYELIKDPTNEKQLLLNCDYINQKDTITIQVTEGDSDKSEAKVIARAKKSLCRNLCK